MRKITLIFLLILLISKSIAQTGVASLKTNNTGIPTLVEYPVEAEKTVADAPNILKGFVNNNTQIDFRLHKSRTQEDGSLHQTYRQYYKNIRLVNLGYTVHSQNSIIENITGNCYNLSETSTIPTVTESDALSNILSKINASKYYWQLEGKSSYYPQAELVILPTTSIESTPIFKLCYLFEITAIEPKLISEYVFIDANTNTILYRNSKISHGDKQGTAETRYNGTKTIYASPNPNIGTTNYALQENGDISGRKAMRTTSANNTSVYDGNSCLDNDNNWTQAEHRPSGNDVALDVHWGGEVCYDYFKIKFGRLGYNGLPKYPNEIGNTLNTVHFRDDPKESYAGAFYHRLYDKDPIGFCVFGDGDEKTNPFVSLDLYAHEYAHGFFDFTSNSAGFHAQKAYGALQESLSDMWASIIENWATPTKNHWIIGEEITKSGLGLRDLSDPHKMLQPKTLGGLYWKSLDNCNPTDANDQCSVHTNAGVMNYWYYLLCQGGSGNNDLGNAYQVNGIGIDKVAQLLYKAEDGSYFANIYYLEREPLSFYPPLRENIITVAKKIWGEYSCEVVSVINAFYAVGIGNKYDVNLTIKGDKQFCTTSNQYTLTGVPTNANIQWLANPINTISFNCPTCNVTTATKLTDGIVTISATSSFCGYNFVTNMLTPVIVGTPNPAVSAVKTSNTGEPTTYNFTAQPQNPDLTYNWYVNNIKNNLESGKGAAFYDFDYYFPCKVTKTAKCNISNTCGTSSFSNNFSKTGECIRAQAHRFAITRNFTASNLLTIKVAQLSEDLLNKYYFGEVSLSSEQVMLVRVYNKEGNLLQETNGIGGSQLDLDISNYAEGTYNIEVIGQGDYRELQTYYLTGLSTTEGSIAEAIATGSIIISDAEQDARLYVMQQNLYYNLQYDQAFMNSSSILTDFSNTTGQGSFGYMFRIDEALFNGDYAAAYDLLNQFTTINTVDQNYKDYYNLYLRYINADVFDATDLSDLYAIAEKCPLTDGEIVYAARSLYNLLSQSTETFNYACGSIGLRTANSNQPQKEQATLIYPNPTKEQFNLVFAPNKKGYNTVSIVDVYGKQIVTQKVSANLSKLSLNLKLNAGLYLVKITNSITGKTETQKLIINN